MADQGSDIDFFGARIKVKSARLAALLNSDLTEDVVVVGKRAVDLFAADAVVEPDVALRDADVRVVDLSDVTDDGE